MTDKRRVRLSIEIDLELRRRIERTAAGRGLSVREYIESVVRQALEAEESVEPLTLAERQRSLRALAELERLDQELLERRGGKPFSPSSELLHEARAERNRQLMQEG